MNFPQTLNRLYCYEDDEITILGNLEKNFFIRASEIMKDFMKVCDKYNTQEVMDYLNARHSPNIVKQFLKKIEIYKGYIFYNIDEKAADYDFNRRITNITLNLCNICNFNCEYCFEENEYWSNETPLMTKEIAKQAIELFLNQLGEETGTIIFTGGEPLLNFDVIKEVVDYVKARSINNIKYTIKTNASLITDKIIDFLILNNFHVQISIDGNEESHNLHRKLKDGGKTFHLVDNVIRKFIMANYGHKVTLNTTLTHYTIRNINEIYEYLESLKGINGYSIKLVMFINKNDFSLNEEDLTIYNKYLFSVAKERYNKDRQKYKHGNYENDICGIGVWHVSIDTNGDVYPCYRLSGIKEYLLGNIFSSGLSFKIPQVLAELYDINKSDKCYNCSTKALCRRGCYADKLLTKAIENCSSLEKMVGEHFLVENLVKLRAHVALPYI